jgi:hypothetical protein
VGLGDLSEDAHTQARARERVSIHHFARQTELETELAHFVLEELAQRLEQLQVHPLGQAAHVVMGLDHVRLAGASARGFDHVWVDRALCQPLDSREFPRLFLEDLDEEPADGLALLLGIGLATQGIKKTLLRVDADDAHAHVTREGFHDLVALAQPNQTVVDEHADQLIADCLVQQCRYD